MPNFPTTPDPSAAALPPDALGGVGMAEVLSGSAERRAQVRSPQAEQKQWFASEVQPHETALRNWLFRNHASLKGDLDDIVQESYLRLLRARTAGPIHCVRTYLFGIARFVALGIYRDRKNISFIPVNELPESDTIEASRDVVAMVTYNQELALTTEAIKQLPDRCREVVTLRTVEGLSYREIAARLGVAEETVRVQMARAVKKCIALLRERSGETREGL